jgi:hypothetical protein
MASNAYSAAPARGFMADQAFFTRFAIALTAFILFGVIQFELRGFVNIMTVPWFLHVHGALMVTWLAMYVLQSSLVSAGQVAIHRKTGWLALALAVGVVGFGSFTGINAIRAGKVPPFFSNPFFLALNQFGILAFAFVVGLAIVKRRQVEWHRRLMLGTGIVIMEPALGRLLPMPLMGQTFGELTASLIQLLMVAIVARHDRKVLGRVHPATLTLALVLVVTHLAIDLLARMPAWQALTQSIAAG